MYKVFLLLLLETLLSLLKVTLMQQSLSLYERDLYIPRLTSTNYPAGCKLHTSRIEKKNIPEDIRLRSEGTHSPPRNIFGLCPYCLRVPFKFHGFYFH